MKTVDRKLCTAQQGSRQKHSTVIQLLLNCHKLYRALDESSSPIIVYLDIFKATDEFLQNAKLKIADSYSTFSQISSGGPQ